MRSSLSLLIIFAQLYSSGVQARNVWTFEPPGPVLTALNNKHGKFFGLTSRLAGFKKDQEPELLKKAREFAQHERLEPLKGGASHGVSTAAMVFILSVFHSSYENYNVSKLKNAPASSYAGIVKDSFVDATNNFQIYLPLPASIVAGKLSSPLALQIYHSFLGLSEKLQTPLIRSVAEIAIVKFGTSVAAFFTWEFVASFFRMSADLIEDPDDRVAAKNLSFWKMTSGLGNTEEKRLFKMLINNAELILVANPELRDHWIDYTLRNSILTGEFISMVQAMVGAGVGLELFVTPAAAGSLPFAIATGVVGGIVHFFLPQSYKDSLTWGVQKVRLIDREQAMLRNDWAIQKIIERSTDGARGYDSNKALEYQLSKRRDLLDSMITIHSERIYNLYSQKSRSENEMKTYLQSYGAQSKEYLDAKQQNNELRSRIDPEMWTEAKATLNAISFEEQKLIELSLKTPNDLITSHLAHNAEGKAVLLKLFTTLCFEQMKSMNLESVETFDRNELETIINGFYMFGYKDQKVRDWVVDSGVTNVTESADEDFN